MVCNTGATTAAIGSLSEEDGAQGKEDNNNGMSPTRGEKEGTVSAKQ
jgi:hypothetical protein